MEDNEVEMSEYQGKCDADALIKAAEIRMDPERLAQAMTELSTRKKAISSIEDLKARKDELDAEEDAADDGDDEDEEDDT